MANFFKKQSSHMVTLVFFYFPQTKVFEGQLLWPLASDTPFNEILKIFSLILE